MKGARLFGVMLLSAALISLMTTFSLAGGPSRVPPEWAFTGRSDIAQIAKARAYIARTPPEVAAKSIGVNAVVRPAARPLPLRSEAVQAALMRPLEPTAARAVVDLRSHQVFIRRGEAQTALPIEVRKGARPLDGRAIAEVAQAGTLNPWLAPKAVVVDAKGVGLRMHDGEAILYPAVLEPVPPGRTTDLPESSTLAAR